MTRMSLVYQMTPKISLSAGGIDRLYNRNIHSRRRTGYFRLFLFSAQNTYSLSTGLIVLHDAFPVGRAERLVFRAGLGPYHNPARYPDSKPEL